VPFACRTTLSRARRTDDYTLGITAGQIIATVMNKSLRWRSEQDFAQSTSDGGRERVMTPFLSVRTAAYQTGFDEGDLSAPAGGVRGRPPKGESISRTAASIGSPVGQKTRFL
jgi:hypothetical protein